MIPLWFVLIFTTLLVVLSAALGYWLGWCRRGAHELILKIEGRHS